MQRQRDQRHLHRPHRSCEQVGGPSFAARHTHSGFSPPRIQGAPARCGCRVRPSLIKPHGTSLPWHRMLRAGAGSFRGGHRSISSKGHGARGRAPAHHDVAAGRVRCALGGARGGGARGSRRTGPTSARLPPSARSPARSPRSCRSATSMGARRPCGSASSPPRRCCPYCLPRMVAR